jgi:hypothetical protein
VRTCIYQPAAVPRGSVHGSGALFLSGAIPGVAAPGGASGMVFEGMLTIAEPIKPTARDALRIRVPLVDGKRVDLYVRVDPGAGPGPNVLKFRSVPDPRIRASEAALQALIGVPLQEVSFEFYPLFSSAADVYSLAVIAVELLLTRPGANHAEQFRDLLNLATRCRDTYSDAPLESRIQAIVGERSEWLQRIGPQSLIGTPIDPQRAMRFITPELWWSTLSLLVRMLPQHGRDSYLRDYGDMMLGSMEGIYQVLLQDLRALMQRAKSLLFGEWGMNRQVGALLEEMRAPSRKR